MPARKPVRKRREAFGAIRQRSSGRYQASYTGPDDGKRYTAPHTFATVSEARGWLAAQRVAIDRGEWEAPGDAARKAAKTTTLGEYAEEWIKTRQNRNGQPLRPRTAAEYRRLLTGPLAPLAELRLTALDAPTVRKWHTDARETGTETQTARAYGLLNTIAATAVDEGLLSRNPCRIRGAQNARTGRKVLPPTDDQLETILATITPRYRAAVMLAAWGALRFGELTELRRSDVVLRMAPDGEVLGVTVNVSRGVTHVVGEGYIVGPTKSEAGVRSVAMPPHTVPVIVEHLLEYVGQSPDALLFPAADGVSHLAQSTFVKHYYPARAAAGRPDMPWHALRHFGATRYALTGATLREIQARLGHATTAAAMRYQHAVGRDEELAALMAPR
jgi:integrase